MHKYTSNYFYSELTRTPEQAFHVNWLKRTQSKEEHINSAKDLLIVIKSPTLAEICKNMYVITLNMYKTNLSPFYCRYEPNAYAKLHKN